MSEQVERRLFEMLGHPTKSPYGNPIPGLDEFGDGGQHEAFMDDVEPLDHVVPGDETLSVTVQRIGEPIQTDEELMAALRRVGAQPDKVVKVARGAEGVLIGSGGEMAEIDNDSASHVFVRRA